MPGRRSAIGGHFVELGEPRVLRRSIEAPEGWTQVRVNRGNRTEVLWRCPHVEKDIQGVYRRCSYTCRKSKTNSRHTHEYLIPPDEDTLLKHKLNDGEVGSFTGDC